MKRLLVLMMLLCVASMAVAGVVWNLACDIDTNTAIIALEGTNIAGFALGNPSMVVSVDGTWGNLWINPDFETGVATSAGAIATTGPNIGKLMNVKGGFVSNVDVYVTGTLWSATYTVAEAPTSWVYFYVGDTAWYNDGTQHAITTEDFAFIPEPMTMALFGVGGLFIRRRRV